MLWILAQTPRRNYNPGNFRQICLLLQFFWRNLDSRHGRLHMSFWQSRLVMALWCQKKIEKRLLQLCLGFKRRISKKRYAIIVLDKNDYVYDYVLKNSHKCRVFKSNNDGDGHQNLIALIPSCLIRQLLANVFGAELWKTVSKSRKRKRELLFCVPVLQKREIWHSHVVVAKISMPSLPNN